MFQSFTYKTYYCRNNIYLAVWIWPGLIVRSHEPYVPVGRMCFPSKHIHIHIRLTQCNIISFSEMVIQWPFIYYYLFLACKYYIVFFYRMAAWTGGLSRYVLCTVDVDIHDIVYIATKQTANDGATSPAAMRASVNIPTARTVAERHR